MSDYHVEFDLDLKKNTYPGKFIVLEGIDASGKTTHIQLVEKFIKEKGKSVFTTKNPTTGEIGQFIRRALKRDFPTTSLAIQYLYVADRHVQQQEIVEHLKKGEVVIQDRYFWSSLAYGLADKTELEFENASQVLETSLGILSPYYQFIVPDLTVYIDISPDMAMERLQKMDKTKEIYEQKESLERVKKGYDWTLSKFKESFVIVDGERAIEEVEKDIEEQIGQLL